MKTTNKKEFNGLICRPIEQFGVALKDIKIPKGWRMPTLQEGIDLVNNDDFFKWSKHNDGEHDFYVQQPFKRNIMRVSWLNYFNYDSLFSANVRDIVNFNRVRGVLLVKEK